MCDFSNIHTDIIHKHDSKTKYFLLSNIMSINTKYAFTSICAKEHFVLFQYNTRTDKGLEDFLCEILMSRSSVLVIVPYK